MTDEPTADRSDPSRRRFLASGAAVTGGAIVGRSPTGARTSSTDASNADESRSTDEATRATPIRGRMFPYQSAPGRRASVVDADIDWRPERIGDGYRTHVIAYDHARSMRAFLFTPPDESLDAGRTFRIETDRSRSATAAGRRLVDVALRPDG